MSEPPNIKSQWKHYDDLLWLTRPAPTGRLPFDADSPEDYLDLLYFIMDLPQISQEYQKARRLFLEHKKGWLLPELSNDVTFEAYQNSSGQFELRPAGKLEVPDEGEDRRHRKLAYENDAAAGESFSCWFALDIEDGTVKRLVVGDYWIEKAVVKVRQLLCRKVTKYGLEVKGWNEYVNLSLAIWVTSKNQELLRSIDINPSLIIYEGDLIVLGLLAGLEDELAQPKDPEQGADPDTPITIETFYRPTECLKRADAVFYRNNYFRHLAELNGWGPARIRDHWNKIKNETKKKLQSRGYDKELTASAVRFGLRSSGYEPKKPKAKK